MHRGRRARAEIGKSGAATHLFDLAAALELFGDGEDVYRLTGLVQLHHGAKHLCVRRLVEVRRLKELGDLDDSAGVDQQRADHGLLCVGRVRGKLVVHDAYPRRECGALLGVSPR